MKKLLSVVISMCLLFSALSFPTAVTVSFVALNKYKILDYVDNPTDAVDDWEIYVPGKGVDWYGRAIRADVAISEDSDPGLFNEYYDLNSNIILAQAEAHGQY